MIVLFNEEKHKYIYEDFPDRELTSVSKIISDLHEKFDAEKIAEKCANSSTYKKKNKLPEDATAADILAMWKEKNRRAIDRGKKFHAMQEEKLYNSKHIVFKHEMVNGFKKSFDLTKLVPGVYPELILHNFEYQIVGTADKVTIYPDKTFSLRDWKTNESLDFESPKIFNGRTKESKKMFTPIAELDDCNGVHYQIQLNLYAWMLEQYGYKCKDMIIQHAIFDDIKGTDTFVNEVQYPVEQMKKVINKILKHIKNKKI